MNTYLFNRAVYVLYMYMYMYILKKGEREEAKPSKTKILGKKQFSKILVPWKWGEGANTLPLSKNNRTWISGGFSDMR